MTDEPIDAALCRLADGTLPDAQADALRDRVRESPELQARLREQTHAVKLTRATAEIAAPASLHAVVRARTTARSPRTSRAFTRRAWRPRVLVPLGAGVVAALVVALVVLSAGSRALTVSRAGQLALASPTRGAPAVDASDTDLLDLRVGAIPFPSYARRAGWRATGARTDLIDARRVQTVFYDVAGQRVGYAIVPGRALRVPPGRRQTIGGVRYVATSADSGTANLVTWRRDGHTCVIASQRVSESRLLRLAIATQATT